MDIFSKQRRSEIMAAISSSDTGPELAVRRLAHALGFRFRTNVKGLPGTPDIAIKWRQKAIFVHGCFWHHHMNCKRASTPQSNREFWEQKFARNTARDKKILAEYKAMGWKPMVVRECELKSPKRLAARLCKYLSLGSHKADSPPAKH